MKERKILARGETESYINELGQIILKQTDPGLGEQYVTLDVSDVPKVIDWLGELLKEWKQWDAEQKGR